MNVSLDLLLAMLVEHGWSFWRTKDAAGSEVRAATKRQGLLVDAVVIFFTSTGEPSGLAYRAPIFPDTDPFSPDFVVWSYEAGLERTIRAILSLPPPGMDAGYIEVTRPPPACNDLPDLEVMSAQYHRRRRCLNRP